MSLQPLFRGCVIRAPAFHLLPEPFRVVHLHKMGQFMNHDVIPDVKGCLNERMGNDKRNPAKLEIHPSPLVWTYLIESFPFCV